MDTQFDEKILLNQQKNDVNAFICHFKILFVL